ncbi:MAG: YbjP/YqhG family protein, partial [Atopostipes suicloacalis]|nr:YbjP/YqhG family protein [Atopostipes suicloacalis]
KFDNQDDFDYVNIRKELLFFTINENEDGVFWNETNITEDDVNAEKETVTFYLRSTTKTRPNRYVEMVKEDGQWKINNILNL